MSVARAAADCWINSHLSPAMAQAQIDKVLRTESVFVKIYADLCKQLMPEFIEAHCVGCNMEKNHVFGYEHTLCKLPLDKQFQFCIPLLTHEINTNHDVNQLCIDHLNATHFPLTFFNVGSAYTGPPSMNHHESFRNAVLYRLTRSFT